MNFKDKSSEFTLLTGVLIGSVVGSTLMGLYYNVASSKRKSKKHNKDENKVNDNTLSIKTCEQQSKDNISTIKSSDAQTEDDILTIKSSESQTKGDISTLKSSDQPSYLTPESQSNGSVENPNMSKTSNFLCNLNIPGAKLLTNNQAQSFHGVCGIYSYQKFGKIGSEKIKEIDTAPLELRKRFTNKGYVFVNQNLATVNTELNEFIELMRKYELHILNGCNDPDTCKCNFRHKRCRLFMIRKYSNISVPQFFSPSCSGVAVISPSNEDIHSGTTIHEFVQMFLNKFSDKVMDLVSYVCYIVDPQRSSEYVVDITMIADPYDRSQRYILEKGGYGQPILEECNFPQSESKVPKEANTNSKNKSTLNSECIVDEFKDDGKIIVDLDSKGTKNHKCTLSWHQDRFVEAKTNQTHSYDFVALFVLSAINVTPHKLMIGKLRNDIDTNNMTLEQIQEHVIPMSDSIIDKENSSDLGYIIDQRKRYFHKHSDFEYLGADSRRNVITIRIKYLK